MNALERLEFEEIEEVDLQEEQKERFKIKDLDAANWAFRKLAAIEKKQQECEELAKKEKQRIELWLESETEKTSNSKRFFESLLEEYFYTERQKDPKFKISTPYGKVSSRKQQDKWIYDDEIAIESLKSKGISHLVRKKEELEKSELKKNVEIMEDVFVLGGSVRPDIKIHNGTFVSMETGEMFDEEYDDIEFYKQLILYKGQIIEGVKVEKQPDKVVIKVEV